MLKILSLFNAQVLQILLQMFINFESTIMVTNGRKGGVQYIESVSLFGDNNDNTYVVQEDQRKVGKFWHAQQVFVSAYNH